MECKQDVYLSEIVASCLGSSKQHDDFTYDGLSRRKTTTIMNEGADWVITLNELGQGNWLAVIGFLPLVSGGVVEIFNHAGLPILELSAREAAILRRLPKDKVDELIKNGGLARLASEVAGDEMDLRLFQRIKEAFEKNGGDIDQSELAQYQLWELHLQGLCVNEKHILLLPNPSTATVFEEFIHATQFRTGRIEKWKKAFGEAGARAAAEIEAKIKLLRNQHAWGISDAEAAQLRRELADELERFKKATGQEWESSM